MINQSSINKLDQLNAAFEKVKNTEHWKNPINKIVDVADEEELNLILESIRFYTATEPYYFVQHDGRIRFQSDGYRLGPAGDH